MRLFERLPRWQEHPRGGEPEGKEQHRVNRIRRTRVVSGVALIGVMDDSSQIAEQGPGAEQERPETGVLGADDTQDDTQDHEHRW